MNQQVISKLTAFTGIIALLFLLAACDSSISGHGEIEDPPLNLKITLGQEEYRLVQQVEADFTVTNISDRTIATDFLPVVSLDLQVEKGDKLILVSRQLYSCTTATSQLNLSPGESETYEFSLANISRERAKSLEQGVYTINAFLLNNYSSEVSASFILRQSDPFNN
ncbi:MAG: BsuPI-related putative proteinase inhibitor [Balneolaceae bacterium]|nr:BsuPI-related putative proteinase inhibitor [Balneolaceae bacterium]